MMFQVAERNGDYIVEAYIIEDPNSTRGYWHPLRNFGCRQGDAFAFRDWDCPKLTEGQLRLLVKNYDPGRRYIRRSATQFIVER